MTGPTTWRDRTTSSPCPRTVLTIGQPDHRCHSQRSIRPCSPLRRPIVREFGGELHPLPDRLDEDEEVLTEDPLFHLRIRHLAALHCLSHVPGTCLWILYQTFKVRPLLRPWSEPFPGHLKLPGPCHRRFLKFLHQELHHQTSLELYQHSRHPVDDRSHLTIIPSWAINAEKEEKGECVVCYGEQEHLQVRCQNCGTMRVCCICIVGIYQSITSCPVCRFRGEF